MPVSKIFILALIAFLIVACDSNRVYEKYKTTGGFWHKDSVFSFQIENIDTTLTYNLFINLRNNNQYPFSNIFLITEFNFPNGNVLVDTLEYKMTSPKGEWLGQGFSDLKENKLWYREKVRFPSKGTYQFSLKHAVRKSGSINPLELLPGVTDVGLSIEKTQIK